MNLRLRTVAIGCLIAVQGFAVSSAAPAELKRENNLDRCLAILRPLGPAGELALHAEADGLSAAEVTVRIK